VAKLNNGSGKLQFKKVKFLLNCSAALCY